MTKPISAAEFKRRFMNRKARTNAAQAVEIRTEVNKPGSIALAADKKRLRTDWRSRDPNPGNYHTGEGPNQHGKALTLGRNRAHLVVSI